MQELSCQIKMCLMQYLRHTEELFTVYLQFKFHWRSVFLFSQPSNATQAIKWTWKEFLPQSGRVHSGSQWYKHSAEQYDNLKISHFKTLSPLFPCQLTAARSFGARLLQKPVLNTQKRGFRPSSGGKSYKAERNILIKCVYEKQIAIWITMEW